MMVPKPFNAMKVNMLILKSIRLGTLSQSQYHTIRLRSRHIPCYALSRLWICHSCPEPSSVINADAYFHFTMGMSLTIPRSCI